MRKPFNISLTYLMGSIIGFIIGLQFRLILDLSTSILSIVFTSYLFWGLSKIVIAITIAIKRVEDRFPKKKIVKMFFKEFGYCSLIGICGISMIIWSFILLRLIFNPYAFYIIVRNFFTAIEFVVWIGILFGLFLTIQNVSEGDESNLIHLINKKDNKWFKRVLKFGNPLVYPLTAVYLMFNLLFWILKNARRFRKELSIACD